MDSLSSDTAALIQRLALAVLESLSLAWTSHNQRLILEQRQKLEEQRQKAEEEHQNQTELLLETRAALDQTVFQLKELKEEMRGVSREINFLSRFPRNES